MPIIFKKKKQVRCFVWKNKLHILGEAVRDCRSHTREGSLSPLTLPGGQSRASYRVYKSWDYREWEEEQEPKLHLRSSFRIFVLLFKKKTGSYPPWTKGQNQQLPYPQARVYNPILFEHEQSCEDTQ